MSSCHRCQDEGRIYGCDNPECCPPAGWTCPACQPKETDAMTIPEGQSREMLLRLCERIGIRPDEIRTTTDDPGMSIVLRGNQAHITLTAVIPSSHFLAIAADTHHDTPR